MRLVINGKSEEVGELITLKELVKIKNLPESQVVIELNGDLAPKESWAGTKLQAGNEIEILRFVGGG